MRLLETLWGQCPILCEFVGADAPTAPWFHRLCTYTMPVGPVYILTTLLASNSSLSIIEPAESVHSIHVAAGSTGHSYEAVFQRCLDGNIHLVQVQDPYIRARHQIHNFVRFCELLVKKCKRLNKISLMTTTGDSSSEVSLQLVAPRLKCNVNVTLLRPGGGGGGGGGATY